MFIVVEFPALKMVNLNNSNLLQMPKLELSLNYQKCK